MWALLNIGGGVCGRFQKYFRGVFIAVYHVEGFGEFAEVIWGGGALGPVKVWKNWTFLTFFRLFWGFFDFWSWSRGVAPFLRINKPHDAMDFFQKLYFFLNDKVLCQSLSFIHISWHQDCIEPSNAPPDSRYYGFVSKALFLTLKKTRLCVKAFLFLRFQELKSYFGTVIIKKITDYLLRNKKNKKQTRS